MRLTAATIVVAFVVAGCSLAPGQASNENRYKAEVELPKDQAGETRRDYAVLEAALNDLADPKNPEHKYHIQNVGPGREIVVGMQTMPGGPDDPFMDPGERSTNIDHTDRQPIPAELRADLRRRNDGKQRSLADFKPRNSNTLVRDIDTEFKGADDFIGRFQEKYPTAWGYVWPYRPGFSKDGRTALLIFEGGPNGVHGLNWVYLLTRDRDRWLVRWRHCRPRE
jgi:hypothetical protein